MFYTPMDTGVYEDNTIIAFLYNTYYPIFFVIWANIGASIIALTHEEHEDKI